MPVEPSRECGESGAIRHLGQLRKNPTEQMAEAVASVHPGDWRAIFWKARVRCFFDRLLYLKIEEVVPSKNLPIKADVQIVSMDFRNVPRLCENTHVDNLFQ